MNRDLCDNIGLAYQIRLQSGEGWSDFIYRASCENGYTRTGIVLDLLGKTSGKSPTHLGLAGETFDAGRAIEVFGKLTKEEVRSVLNPPTRTSGTHVSFFGREVRKKTFFETYRRVAPTSLRENCYQKAIWSVRGITFDPKTHEELLVQCPRCSRPLSFAKSIGVELCAECFSKRVKVDFRDYPQKLIDVDDGEALKLATDLIDPEVPAPCLQLDLVPRDLRELGAGALFELIMSMAKFESFCFADQSRTSEIGIRLTTPSPTQLAKAARAVITWPKGFSNYCEEMRFLYEQRTSRKLSVEGNRQSVRHPITQILAPLDGAVRQIVSAGFYNERQQALFGSISGSTLGSAALVPLSDTVDVLQTKLGRTGLRRAYAISTLTREGQARVEPYVAKFVIATSSRPVRDFSTRMGIPTPFIVDLFARNVIEVLDADIEQHLGRSATAPSQKLDVRVTQNAVNEVAPVDALPLIDVLAILSRRRVNCLAAAMSPILSVRLPIWVLPGTLPLMARLRVRDFAMVSHLLQGEAETAGFCDMPADVRSASTILGLSKASVLLLRRGEFLPSNPTLGDVFSFREAFVSSSEVQRRLRIAGEVRDITHVNKELASIGLDKIGAKRRRQSIALRERVAVEAYYGKRLAARV
ncbi:hypothetical protein CO659_08545 [Rhizobium sp. S9]|uniref:hypothetical protein n=1 Tax=Rhizobium sp. S9 TaxID=2035454 RepID=UPI000BE971F9|nr:hypothetical protein [Rhizobium sp. S9]PDS98004.1 hypothetical protein CO659_08545 [Rhizobium sp. S9]